MNHEITAEEANELAKKVVEDNRDQDKLANIYVQISQAASNGEFAINLEEDIERFIFEKLEDLRYNVKRFTDQQTGEVSKIRISWISSEIKSPDEIGSDRIFF